MLAAAVRTIRRDGFGHPCQENGVNWASVEIVDPCLCTHCGWLLNIASAANFSSDHLPKSRLRFLIFCEVDCFPVTPDNALANLRWSLPFVGLFVDVKQLLQAGPATRSVLGGIAVQQTAVTVVAVAIAVARLLIESLCKVRSQTIGGLHYLLFKLSWIQHRGQLRVGRTFVICRDTLTRAVVFFRHRGVLRC